VVLAVVYMVLSITIVPAGTVGVVDVFGQVRDDPLPAGMNFVFPLASVVKMSIKTQIIELAENVPTKEGLTVHLEAAALIRLEPQEAVKMYRQVGYNYMPKVVIPQFRSIVREVTSGHEAKDLYTSVARTAMTADLKSQLGEAVKVRGVVVEETPLKKLELPKALQQAIEDKLQAEQASQKMQFVLDRERQEAERKGIEAEGISAFQKIVSNDINEGMLRWKGVEATQKLTNSPNTRIVIVGSGKNGLPLILNDEESEIGKRWVSKKK
jgi:regulator of protease activity HflC (stomatin/prohibitin superfamily)